jgi:hypothetical protein
MGGGVGRTRGTTQQTKTEKKKECSIYEYTAQSSPSPTPDPNLFTSHGVEEAKVAKKICCFGNRKMRRGYN